MATVRKDFFLPPAHRLTEQERALMTAMLHRLIEEVATEIQLHLPREWLPANEDHNDTIERLVHSGLLAGDGFIGLLLRRADEERIASAFGARPGHSASSIVQPLVSHEDAEIAAAAMAVLIARGRRRDRYGRALIELDDVPESDAASFVHAVAAALSERKPVHLPMSDAGRELCNAAAILLRRYDPTRSLDHATGELIRLLDQRELLHNAWIRLAMDSGEMQLFGHALARRAAIDPALAASELLSGESRRIMLLLRLADVPRDLASHMLAVLGDLLGIAPDLHALNLFGGFSAERVEAARSLLRLDPRFKHALQALGHGNRSF